MVYHVIDTSKGQNATKIQVRPRDENEWVVVNKAIADAYGNCFYVPLNFELLESHLACHQSALGDRLEYEFTLNVYSRMIQAMNLAQYAILLTVKSYN